MTTLLAIGACIIIGTVGAISLEAIEDWFVRRRETRGWPRRISHTGAHLMGHSMGRIESWWTRGRLMHGFRCSCGRLTHVEESATTKEAA